MCEPAAILAELQIFVTLEDGDVVMTGTPKGVDVIAAGDEFIGKASEVALTC
ncbi:MAG: fumarylacetoacetate hydrolase family protein [Alteromonadaceae bacterium]|nr:fumarylacetoacetate hydrolase family protein [Alteromonadaceae bacterium]